VLQVDDVGEILALVEVGILYRDDGISRPVPVVGERERPQVALPHEQLQALEEQLEDEWRGNGGKREELAHQAVRQRSQLADDEIESYDLRLELGRQRRA